MDTDENNMIYCLNKDGYKVCVRKNSIAQNKVPEPFSVNNIFTIDNIRKFIENKDSEIELLSDKYISCSSKLVVRSKISLKTREMSWDKIRDYKTFGNIHKKNDDSNRLNRVGTAGDGVSTPEKMVRELLNQSNVCFEPEKKFEWSNNKRYDIYIKKTNTIIEIHGMQHYKKNNWWRSLDEEQENDVNKKNLAIKNGITDYIVVDCRYSRLNFLKNSFETSLYDILDYEKIDYRSAYLKSVQSMVDVASEMWKLGSTVKVMSEELNISTRTVYRYLKIASDAGIIEYSPKESISRSNKGSGANRIKISMQSANGEILHFKSITEAISKKIR